MKTVLFTSQNPMVRLFLKREKKVYKERERKKMAREEEFVTTKTDSLNWQVGEREREKERKPAAGDVKIVLPVGRSSTTRASASLLEMNSARKEEKITKKRSPQQHCLGNAEGGERGLVFHHRFAHLLHTKLTDNFVQKSSFERTFCTFSRFAPSGQVWDEAHMNEYERKKEKLHKTPERQEMREKEKNTWKRKRNDAFLIYCCYDAPNMSAQWLKRIYLPSINNR